MGMVIRNILTTISDYYYFMTEFKAGIQGMFGL